MNFVPMTNNNLVLGLFPQGQGWDYSGMFLILGGVVFLIIAIVGFNFIYTLVQNAERSSQEKERLEGLLRKFKLSKDEKMFLKRAVSRVGFQNASSVLSQETTFDLFASKAKKTRIHRSEYMIDQIRKKVFSKK